MKKLLVCMNYRLVWNYRLVSMNYRLVRITGWYGITGYKLLIENSRMLGNSYGITGLIVGYLRRLARFEVKFVNYQIKN